MLRANWIQRDVSMRLEQALQELTPVFGLPEQKLIAVGTSEDVMQRVGQIRARFPGHLFKLRRDPAFLCRGSVTSLNCWVRPLLGSDPSGGEIMKE